MPSPQVGMLVGNTCQASAQCGVEHTHYVFSADSGPLQDALHILVSLALNPQPGHF